MVHFSQKNTNISSKFTTWAFQVSAAINPAIITDKTWGIWTTPSLPVCKITDSQVMDRLSKYSTGRQRDHKPSLMKSQRDRLN